MTNELIANAFDCPIAFFTTQTNLANLLALLIQLGVLLIATPVARVAFSVYIFLRQRDRLYVFVTLLVLALLLFSLFSGGWLPGG